MPYQVLGFAKIINIIHERGGDQKTWIRGVLTQIREARAVARVNELQRLGTDVAEHVYVSCRCAVAHAYASPVVNPDSFADERRLDEDLPLVRELADLVLMNELGLKR